MLFFQHAFGRIGEREPCSLGTQKHKTEKKSRKENVLHTSLKEKKKKKRLFFKRKEKKEKTKEKESRSRARMKTFANVVS